MVSLKYLNVRSMTSKVLHINLNLFSPTECQISTHPPESIFIELRIVGESSTSQFSFSFNKFIINAVMKTDLIMIMRKRC